MKVGVVAKYRWAVTRVGVVAKYRWAVTRVGVVAKYRNDSSTVEAAIIFSDTPLTDRSYTVRFNPRLRPLPDPGNGWVSSTSCRGEANTTLESPVTCPPNSYYFSGFLGLQGFVDWAILTRPVPLVGNFSFICNDKTPVPRAGDFSFICNNAMPSVLLATFPLDAVVSSNLDVLRSIIPLYMVFSWAQFIVYMLILIVEEKEKKIKEGMKMMGLQGIVYWLSWLTVYGLYVVILATICVIVLPLANIFQQADLGLVFLLFILYGLSSIILALLMTPFFSKAKVAGVVGNLLQVFMSLLFYLQVYLGDEIDPVYFWVLGLMSPCAFSLAIDKILTLDVTAGGLSYSTIWEGPGLPYAGSLIMISVDIVLYLILALYLDAVVPTEYGTKEKPWFFLKPSFWKSKKKTPSGLNFSNPEMEEHPNEEERGSHYDTLKSSSSGSSSMSSSVNAEGDIERMGSEMRGKEGVIIRGVSKVFNRGRKKPPLHAVKSNLFHLISM
ncbi:hypothetical protein FHG87_008514 [Trinorchestia longiramus]|nr:hypothetical protein FHG87_008514 [Trinorchestia longiramus]